MSNLMYKSFIFIIFLKSRFATDEELLCQHRYAK